MSTAAVEQIGACLVSVRLSLPRPPRGSKTFLPSYLLFERSTLDLQLFAKSFASHTCKEYIRYRRSGEDASLKERRGEGFFCPPKSFPFKIFRTLCSLSQSEIFPKVLFFQSLAHSFPKTPGVGVLSIRYRPGGWLTDWTGRIPDTLLSKGQLRVQPAYALENEQCDGRKTSFYLGI
jgi:hypothetical protein